MARPRASGQPPQRKESHHRGDRLRGDRRKLAGADRDSGCGSVGNPLNGITQAGNGIAKTNYLWPKLAYAPRFGFSYDVTGKSSFVIRGGGGLFYDRPDGNAVFTNPAKSTDGDDSRTCKQGVLQTLGTGGGISPLPVASAQYHPIQRQGPDHRQLEYRCPMKIPALADGRGCVLCWQPRL